MDEAIYIFCFEYQIEEGCTNKNCIKNIISNNYLHPYIVYKAEDINNNIDIISMFNNLMCNDLNTCKKCGYDKEGMIINIANPTFYRIIRNKIPPKILFVIFDLLNEYDAGMQIELEKIEFKRRGQYNNQLLNILKKTIHQESTFYELKAIILTPQYDHFTAIIFNYQNENLDLKKGKDYFYDGIASRHNIEECNDLKGALKDNIIYLGIYVEIDQNNK